MSIKNNHPTEKELEILQILWENGPCSVKFINENSTSNKPVGYTTTLKLMQIMTDKGILQRKKDGKSHIYEAIVGMDKTQELLTNKFMSRVFNGSVSQLVMQVLGNGKTTPKELDEVKKYIRQIENKK